MTKEKFRILAVLAFLVVGSTLVTSRVLAQVSADNTRPGNGWGDTNHVHTGPPGQSVRPANSFR